MEITRTITIEETTAAIKAVVESYGEDYVYEPQAFNPAAMQTKPSYVQPVNGPGRIGTDTPVCPSCIVGHVLARLDVPLEAMQEVNFRGVDTLTHHLKGKYGITFENRARLALQEAQRYNDSRQPWRMARDASMRLFS